MTARRFAGTVAAGSVITALSAGIVAVWTLFDCVRFQTRPGECNETAASSVPTIVAGGAAVVVAVSSWWVGYETLNPSLRKARRRRGPDGKFLPNSES